MSATTRSVAVWPRSSELSVLGVFMQMLMLVIGDRLSVLGVMVFGVEARCAGRGGRWGMGGKEGAAPRKGVWVSC